LKNLSQGVSTRRYGVRGPVILIVRYKQTSVRGHAPTHATAPGVIKLPYHGYGPSGVTQPQFMKFIPTL